MLNDKTIFIAISYKEEGMGEVDQYNHRAWSTIWARKPLVLEYERDTFIPSDGGTFVYGFKLNEEQSEILFSAENGYDTEDGVYKFDLNNKKVIRITRQAMSHCWDYNPKTNKIIWFDYDKEKLKEKQLN